MPKLGNDLAEKVENAEDGFKPVPDGIYVAQLMEDVDVREGDKGTYWRWVFQVPTEHEGDELEYSGRRFWLNTSLSEAAFFRLKEVFAAFGVPTNTDTDELVGRKVKLLIGSTIIQRGQRKGEPSNEIQKVLPLDHEVAATSADSGKGGSSEEPLF